MKKHAAVLIICGVLIIVPSRSAHAQKEVIRRQIGILHAGTPPDVNADIFIEGLRQQGYSDGKNISIVHRFAQGRSDRLPELAKELAQLKVNALFGGGAPAAIALKQATNTIPI